MIETALPLVAFAFAMSITPGPNNVLLTASGVNFGLRRTLPHIAGSVIGFGSLLLLAGLGLGVMMERVPALQNGVKIAGAAYLIYLAWRIVRAGRGGDAADKARPLTFLEAAALQYVNPKGWVVAATVVSGFVFVKDHMLANAAVTALLFMAVTGPAMFVWTAFGTGLRRLLAGPRAMLAFNATMAALVLGMLPFLLM